MAFNRSTKLRRRDWKQKFPSRISNCFLLVFHYCFWSIACLIIGRFPFQALNEELGETFCVCFVSSIFKLLSTPFLPTSLIPLDCEKTKKGRFQSLHWQKSIERRSSFEKRIIWRSNRLSRSTTDTMIASGRLARFGMALTFFSQVALCEACQSFVMIFLINLKRRFLKWVLSMVTRITFLFYVHFYGVANELHLKSHERNWNTRRNWNSRRGSNLEEVERIASCVEEVATLKAMGFFDKLFYVGWERNASAEVVWKFEWF